MMDERRLMKRVYLTRHKLHPFASCRPRQINLVGLNRRGGRCMGNVRSARRADNGRDCLAEAEVPTIARVGRVGESVGSGGGRRVGGPRRACSVRGLRCSATRSLAPGPLQVGVGVLGAMERGTGIGRQRVVVAAAASGVAHRG